MYSSYHHALLLLVCQNKKNTHSMPCTMAASVAAMMIACSVCVFLKARSLLATAAAIRPLYKPRASLDKWIKMQLY
jgi:hypothetical protein